MVYDEILEISDIMDEIKQNITDNQYKTIMDLLMKIKKSDYVDKKNKRNYQFKFEILEKNYDKAVLETYININILQMINTTINGYSATDGNYTISLKSIMKKHLK
jgi:hypothetical protein